MRNGIIVSAIIVLSVGISPALAADKKDHTKFEHAEAKIHHNTTDGDSEVTFMIKSQKFGFMELTVTDPNGRKMSALTASKAVPAANGRAYEIESTEVELPKLLSAFPAGKYKIHGRDTNGTVITGAAVLSHVMPPKMERLEPKDPASLANGGVVRWKPVAGAVRYVIKIENEQIKHKYRVELPSSITSLTVPADWMSSEGEYQLGLGAVNKFGNLTELQSDFKVRKK